MVANMMDSTGTSSGRVPSEVAEDEEPRKDCATIGNCALNDRRGFPMEYRRSIGHVTECGECSSIIGVQKINCFRPQATRGFPSKGTMLWDMRHVCELRHSGDML